MNTLTEVSNLVGLTTQTIREYERSGLSNAPKAQNKNGDPVYSSKDIDRLWQLRIFEELDYDPDQVKNIMDNPNYDMQKSLRMQIAKLTKKKETLENLIAAAKKIECNS